MPISSKQREEFDKILERIISELPEDFREMLRQVPLMVEDEPSEDLQLEMGAHKEGEEAELMGLHSGPTISTVLKGEVMETTPLIQLFRGPIIRAAGTSLKSLQREIRTTLIHEMGHHFDFCEQDLEDRGFG